MRTRLGLAPGALRSVVAQPSLWATALRQLLALAPRRWWRRSPRLPVPDAAYLAFRRETMYGDRDGDLGPDDVLAYLRWCREFRSLGGYRRGMRVPQGGSAGR